MLVLVLVLLSATSCGSCDDQSGAFFEPTSFGTHVYSIDPDIDGPHVIDFGDVTAGSAAEQEFFIRNVGRANLHVAGIELVAPEAFAVDTAPLDAGDTLIPGDTRALRATYAPTDGAAARGELHVDSNDPDEPRFRVALIANRTTPCLGNFDADRPIWEFHHGEGPMCWPDVAASHGHESEYRYAEVPGWRDAGWRPDPDNHISFEQRSTLCGTDCACRGGGDFTYFQTFLYVPDRARLHTYEVEMRDVDDGARVTIYNGAYPRGVTDPASYARIPGGSTADLAPYLVAGMNRVVITHVDDCCQISRIRDVFVTAAGSEVERCD